MISTDSEQSQEKRLESWKEIEAYLKRDFRTLRRWEREEELPIHRRTRSWRAAAKAGFDPQAATDPRRALLDVPGRAPDLSIVH